jgi:hypothetical protein
LSRIEDNRKKKRLNTLHTPVVSKLIYIYILRTLFLPPPWPLGVVRPPPRAKVKKEKEKRRRRGVLALEVAEPLPWPMWAVWPFPRAKVKK